MRRLLLTVLLTSTSVPLHPFFNSTIYTSLPIYGALEVTATAGFERNDPFNLAHQDISSVDDSQYVSAIQKKLVMNDTSVQCLSHEDCWPWSSALTALWIV